MFLEMTGSLVLALRKKDSKQTYIADGYICGAMWISIIYTFSSDKQFVINKILTITTIFG